MNWILALCMLLCISNRTLGSTTTVGNGDDGRDLERLVPIDSGPIFDSRKSAVARLKALNVQGIPELGILIPELENTQLLLVQDDVRPLDSEGEWEISADRQQVYARTFAEPHSPTRFFPAATKLNQEQLIALHTHEALHRALPPHVREDEEKVALLTMALVSPAANFDRVNRIVQSTVNPAAAESRRVQYANASRMKSIAKMESQTPTQKAQVFLSHWTYSDYGMFSSVERLGAEFSPFDTQVVLGYMAEPRLLVEGLLLHDGAGMQAGPLSFLLKAPLKNEVGPGRVVTPFARFTLNSMDRQISALSQDRDVYTIGAKIDLNPTSSYSSYSLGYTPPGEFNSNTDYGAIWSYDMRIGTNVRRFAFGGTMSLYHMLAKGREDSLTIVQAGPEVRYRVGRFTFNLMGTVVLNRQADRRLSELGDLVGHGAGSGGLNAGLAIAL